MITAIALLVVVLDDLRLRGKLRGVSAEVKKFEQQFENQIVLAGTAIVASIKKHL